MKLIDFKYKTHLLFAFLVLVFSACTPLELPFPQSSLAQCNNNQFANHPQNQAYSQIIKEVALKQNIPGISMLVEKKGVLWQGAYGKAHLENDIPMTICHQFRTASITKTFTAAMTMKYVEQGRLRLNQTIKDLLPELAGKIQYSDQITLKNLLNHTSGMYSLGMGNTKLSLWIANSPEKFAKYDPYWQLDEFVFNFKPYSEPDKTWIYNNANYVLLGLILEKIGGKSYTNLLEELILRPAQMSNTFLLESSSKQNLASGYSDYLKQGVLFNSYRYDQYAYETPYGGIVSNAEDLLKFGKYLFKSNFLSENTKKQMLEWVKLPSCDNGNCEYGLGIELWRLSAGEGYGHAGGLEGYNSTLLYIPSKDTFLVFLANKSGIGKNFFDDFLKD
ncbi:MAG: beta-lactamase family protein [Thermoflexibacter sp.]|jgi:D-alanyl-D-alanine carboxypeptidase|nr:beta-lactamase family protein [Thermoflexibacter sp.]